MSQSNVAAIKPGDVFSLLRYCTVVSVGADEFSVRTDDGNTWDVSKAIVAQSCYTAAQFNETRDVTRTELAAVFERCGDHVWSLEFHKQVDPNAVADRFTALDDDVRSMTQAKRRKLARELLEGETRTMTGRLVSHSPDVNGRYRVIDLALNEERLVDPRTLEWLVYQNVKYVRK